ncbi:MAG: HepT-like ribonuclease domain-containing protein [Pseudomonadota bacterium]
MSKRDDSVSVQDMLVHAQEAVELVGDDRFEVLDQDRVRQLALTRLMEIIGEAAKRVSSNTRQAHPEIPWAQIIGMRNRLVHGYDVIDFDLLWDTVKSDLPPLIELLDELLDTLD